MQPNLGAARCYAKGLCNFFVIHLPKKTQCEDFSILIRQFCDFASDAVMYIFVSKLLLGRKWATDDCCTSQHAIFIFGRWLGERYVQFGFMHRSAPQPIERDIGSYTV